MTVNIDLPEVGHIVEVLRGRERGQYAVVIGHVEGRFVLLADGNRRRVERPKRKNVLHIRKTGQTLATVAPDGHGDQKLNNAHLRYVMRRFRQLTDDEESFEEGSGPNGQR